MILRPPQLKLGRKRYPAVIRLWDNAREESIPFLDYDVEIRRVIFSTNVIESLIALLEGGESSRSFPQRASCAQVFVPGDPFAGPTG